MRSIPSRLVVAAATFLSLSLIATACGSDDATESVSSTTTVPSDMSSEPSPDATVDDGFPLVDLDVYGTTVSLGTRPERIISLSPSSTEGLFAIGAGPQVIAADEYSDYPAEAPTTDLSGFTPNVEAIVAYDPDLVIAQYDPGDLVASLEAAGIPIVLLPSAVALDEVFLQLEILGAITGNPDAAGEVIVALEERIDTAVAAAPPLADPLGYLHLLDDTLFSVTSSTFIGSVYGLFGLVNVADAADPDGEAFGYPQLSAEYLVESDPDLVFVTFGDAASFAQSPVLGTLRAVDEGNVIALSPDVTSRWGPRIVDFIEQVATTIERVAAAGALVLVR
jgi:iron complex transport system substrate-binding protein